MVVSLDGKSLRGFRQPSKGRKATHLLNAFSVQNSLALGQLAIDDKSNELTALPLFIQLLDIAGAIVTIDAAGCYEMVVRAVIDKKADYVLALKQNQPALWELATETFELHDQGQSVLPTYIAQDEIDGSHGRIDQRVIQVIPTHSIASQLNKQWPGLKAIARVTHLSEKAGEMSVNRRFYITSLPANEAHKILNSIRAHWLIENRLHWSLDVTMGEDKSRIRDTIGAANISWLRKLVLGILKRANLGFKGLSIKVKQKFIAGNPEELIPRILQTI